ncbi:uncharacterized protein LOC122569604 isoform X2 [Bombus pyrosoma]|uniref:uncharacterized protein LOC122569604 isoform X2 n=1 Tax=Bombus pyrosoma TaxID=396416 RepID=UPI001CB9B334|nr:uncharacterized protein LOC122569604 isoform X2 [Bombus pyrosoma]
MREEYGFRFSGALTIMTSVITLCADSRIRHQGRYLIQSTYLSSRMQVRYSNVLELAIVNFLCMQLNDAYTKYSVMNNISMH